MLQNDNYLEQALRKHSRYQLRCELVSQPIVARSSISNNALSRASLLFVPLHPKKLGTGTDYLWRQWSLRNRSVRHKTILRSKIDSVFNRKLNLEEVPLSDDVPIAVRAYRDLYHALHGIPSGTFVYVGYYVGNNYEEAYDEPDSVFLVDGQFMGVVLLRIT